MTTQDFHDICNLFGFRKLEPTTTYRHTNGFEARRISANRIQITHPEKFPNFASLISADEFAQWIARNYSV